MNHRIRLAAAGAFALVLAAVPAAASVAAPSALAHRVVPVPGPDNTVVTVRTGGDRAATDVPAPLAGV
ncbi:hypothetical protein ACF1FE_39050, partial [Streptomyces griseofuscus]